MNLFANLGPVLPDELIETLVESDSIRIERIVSQGQTSPPDVWFDQEENEWVVVLRGAARLRFANQTIEMRPGDYTNIPAHTKHRVEWTDPHEPTVWLAVHYSN